MCRSAAPGSAPARTRRHRRHRSVRRPRTSGPSWWWHRPPGAGRACPDTRGVNQRDAELVQSSGWLPIRSAPQPVLPPFQRDAAGRTDRRPHPKGVWLTAWMSIVLATYLTGSTAVLGERTLHRGRGAPRVGAAEASSEFAFHIDLRRRDRKNAGACGSGAMVAVAVGAPRTSAAVRWVVRTWIAGAWRCTVRTIAATWCSMLGSRWPDECRSDHSVGWLGPWAVALIRNPQSRASIVEPASPCRCGLVRGDRASGRRDWRMTHRSLLLIAG